jgi:hypothetical protein
MAMRTLAQLAATLRALPALNASCIPVSARFRITPPTANHDGRDFMHWYKTTQQKNACVILTQSLAI